MSREVTYEKVKCSNAYPVGFGYHCSLTKTLCPCIQAGIINAVKIVDNSHLCPSNPGEDHKGASELSIWVYKDITGDTHEVFVLLAKDEEEAIKIAKRQQCDFFIRELLVEVGPAVQGIQSVYEVRAELKQVKR